MNELVSLKNVGKSFSGRVIFHKVNMDIVPNEPVVVIGENGCGKSTLLKIVAGVLSCTEGEVNYRPKVKISFVPDRFPKLPFTIENYLMHMGRIQGLTAGYINDCINEYFDRLNMLKLYRKTKISKCSKGTIQKVNIMQALIAKPDLLVLDEPFAGLDEDSADSLMELLHKLIAEGMAIILACHERKRALKAMSNVYIFSQGNETYTVNPKQSKPNGDS